MSNNKNIIIFILAIIVVVLLYQNINTKNNTGTENTNGVTADIFEKKRVCGEMGSEVKKTLAERDDYGINNYLVRIFYSPERDSCLYYFIENWTDETGMRTFVTLGLTDALTRENIYSKFITLKEGDYLSKKI